MEGRTVKASVSSAGLHGSGGRAAAWLAVAVLALVGVLMLAVFPARTLVAQRRERAQTAARVKDLAERNQRLDAQARLLQTDAEIERLARQHYNLVRPGEEVFAILPPGPPPAPVVATSPRHSSPSPLWRRTMELVTDLF